MQSDLVDVLLEHELRDCVELEIFQAEACFLLSSGSLARYRLSKRGKSRRKLSRASVWRFWFVGNT